jgi:N-methylhydantoinase A
MPFSITMDTGGTFSDLTLADESGILGLYKAPTTPENMFDGIKDAIALAAEAQDLTVASLLSRTTSFVYSTTRATNAVLQGQTARTAFITTEGHRDILLYREGGKEKPLDIATPYPAPYVPRSLTFGLKERILSDGTVRIPLDQSNLVAIADRLREVEVEAVGVCLLWSIANPDHELRVGQFLGEYLPGVECTLSHQINPIVREYRRASATVIDASLKPLMRAHLHDVDRRLRELGCATDPLMVTHLSGGVLRMDEMCEQPLHAVDSGPALAPVAGLAYAKPSRVASDKEIVVIDAGGTSFDISPTRDGAVVYSREKWLGPRWTGHLTGLPAVETRSVGAGGGSVASVDGGGLLKVGPISAGAVPGPACYGRGGRCATVTDAAVVLGYLDPDYFLGGRMRLDAGLAYDAVEREVASPLGLDVQHAAGAVMTIFTENIRSFLFETMIGQGLDPRRSVIVAGGGAAGLNIVEIAKAIGVTHVMVPYLAAGLSAVGGQYSDVVATFSKSRTTRTDGFDFEAVNSALRELRQRVDAFALRNGATQNTTCDVYCEARYADQLWELTLPLGSRTGFAGLADVLDLQHRFDELHESVFAVAQPGHPVEVITWRADARIHRPKPDLFARAAAEPGPARSRKAWIGGELVDCEVHAGATLAADVSISGPAIVEEPATTLVLPPGATATVESTHYLVEVG